MEIYDSWGFPIVKDLEGICVGYPCNYFFLFECPGYPTGS